MQLRCPTGSHSESGDSSGRRRVAPRYSRSLSQEHLLPAIRAPPRPLALRMHVSTVLLTLLSSPLVPSPDPVYVVRDAEVYAYRNGEVQLSVCRSEVQELEPCQCFAPMIGSLCCDILQFYG